ncbi:2Fe-2S iron-sulfur cluster-binding protein [Colwellia psychrerythraea]|uniref:Nitric oxide dioxygenase n=1 Tax=Colwellia psychrerythraea TaxID=28229 RepID=A0A099KE24_COLPS|nr:2Fe-2S iron-sulfur cluster-binding protein [Colwellia psychrerythraea]KGJ88545.1 Nitric oxide dioxygenase [Colwellia psychrerythraea]
MTLSSATTKDTFTLVCQKIQQETHDVKTYLFTQPKREKTIGFNYYAGQYLNFTVNMAGTMQACCYTLSSTPTNSAYVSITIKRIPQGKVSNYFHDHFKVGRSIHVKEIAGNFCIRDSIPPKILLISAGSGITPMLSMLRFMTEIQCKNQIIFIHSAKQEIDLIAQAELNDLAKRHGNCQIIYTLTQGANSQWHGFQGRLNEQMLSNIKQINHYEAFVCGPKLFRNNTQALLLKLGAEPSNFHEESFGKNEYSTGDSNDIKESISVLKTEAEHQEINQQSLIPQNSNKKVSIYFSRWKKRYQGNQQDSLLDQGEAAGLILPHSCRGGSCGSCKAKLISGQVEQHSTDGLSEREQRQGYILLCSCHALTDVEISHE